MSSRRQRAEQRRQELETPRYGWIWKPLVILLAILVMVAVGLSIWWSVAPSRFDVETATQQQRISAAPAARGTVSVATLATLIDTLQDKPGGYVRNDLLPPGLWMDNMAAWETGVLTQARIMASSLSHFDTQSGAAVDELIAALYQDADDWLAPSMEDHLALAGQAAREYLARFDDGAGASFGEQGVGAASYLESVREALAALRERLSSAVADTERLTELGIEVPREAEVPWYRVDDVFHETRGQTWALYQLLVALERDQADSIAAAGLSDDYARALAELERMQRQFWSPMVLRGSGLGIFANYPLSMAHHLSRLDSVLLSLTEGLASEGGGSAAASASTQEADAASGKAAAVNDEAADDEVADEVGEASADDAAPASPEDDGELPDDGAS
ncbi:DUF2333 family protein [Halomonas denitrificans]|uniref:DUF2333 family protein n=1 Tax=Halomonas TaxID=2745 RepID=UPI001A8F4F8D|nr:MULTISPECIES: DUF2333 family protein [Halomonas]MBN8413495.1 DUF2333 family protein [Halomonas litopenaei]MCA0973201.1 DUF2333 family protein [Halomonas denitrificans]